MKYSLVLLMLLAIPCWSQTTTGKAETTGPCSPAVTASNNQFTINCQGIDKEQGQKMLDILNKILNNQLDPKTVIEKLDEILKAVNQRVPIDRRLSPEQKTALAACLKTNPGKYTIGALQGNREAYTYALDWSETFSAAGWINEQPIPIAIFMVGGGIFPPLRMSLHGTVDQLSKKASVITGSPEEHAFQCFSTIPLVGADAIMSEDTPTGSVRISVSDR
jgi:hypothetical protein